MSTCDTVAALVLQAIRALRREASRAFRAGLDVSAYDHELAAWAGVLDSGLHEALGLRGGAS